MLQQITESERATLAEAERIYARFFERESMDICNKPEVAAGWIKAKIATMERECFGIILLDNAHRCIAIKDLFYGTVNGATVNARELVKTALNYNAASVVLYHNHPSGQTKPSEADKAITNRAKETLGLVDVKVLDHIIVGDGFTSFAQERIL